MFTLRVSESNFQLWIDLD